MILALIPPHILHCFLETLHSPSPATASLASHSMIAPLFSLPRLSVFWHPRPICLRLDSFKYPRAREVFTYISGIGVKTSCSSLCSSSLIPSSSDLVSGGCCGDVNARLKEGHDATKRWFWASRTFILLWMMSFSEAMGPISVCAAIRDL